MKLLALLLLAMLPTASQARTVSGRVVDNQSEPLSYANVILLSDSAYVAGTITDDNGTFLFEHVADTVNMLKAVMVGFKDHLAPITDGTYTITLQPSTLELKELTVTKTLPQTQLKGNAFVTKIEGSILEKSGTAKDLLGRLPLVTDKGDELEVFGRGTPIIYINGRLVRDNADLERLESDQIKSVEVITNPGARYSAGVSSVIRIHTKRPKGEGFGIDLRSHNSITKYFNSNENVDFRYNRGGLELFGYAGAYFNKYYNSYEGDQITYIGNDIWKQSLFDKSIGRSTSLFGKIGFNYMLSEKHSFGAYYQYGTSNSNSDSDGNSTIVHNGQPYDKWSTLSHSEDDDYPRHFVNTYYSGTIGELQVDFNADYMKSSSKKGSNVGESSENFDDKDLTTYSKTDRQLFAEKLVLVYPIWQGEIEVGEEYTNSRLEYLNNYTNLDLANSSNQVREDNIATFVQLQQKFGEVALSLGLRYEHVDNRYYGNGALISDQSRKYDDLFPSLSISFPIKHVNTSFSFASKTIRPYYHHLSGNIQYINRSTFQRGNPFLRPAQSYDFQLQSMWQNYSLVATFSHLKDAIFNTSKPMDDDPTVRVITYENVPDISKMYVAVNAQHKFGLWTSNLSTGVVTQWYDGMYRGEKISFDKPVLTTQFRNTFNLPYGFIFNADFSFNTGGEAENVKLRPSNTLSFGLRKSFFNDALSLRFDAWDILERSSAPLTMYLNDYSIYSTNSDLRRFQLTVRYKFNVTRSKYKGTGAGNSEKERM